MVVGSPEPSRRTGDIKLLGDIQADTQRFTEIEPLGHGNVFLIARAHDKVTEKGVLLTVARSGDLDARRQLGVVRRLMTDVADERLGTVVERLWQKGRNEGWACMVSTLHPRLWTPQAIILSEADDTPAIETFRLVRRLCVQVHALHSAGYAHGDLSPTNVGVDERGIVHLIDFEHVVSSENVDRRRVGATPGFTHPSKIATIGSGITVTMADHIRWDMYGLGKIILAILDAALPIRYPELTPWGQRALRLIGCLLLHEPEGATGDVALGLPKRFLDEQRFGQVADAIAALDRLTGRARLDAAVPELDHTRESVMQVASHSTVPFTHRVRSVLDSAEMQRLNTFQQLGLISFIWPTASHRRLEHAIGTFGMTCTVVRSLLSDPQNPLFTTLMTPRLIRTTLLAALLHDVGHFPLAHDLEEAYFSRFDHENRSIDIATKGGLAALMSTNEPDGWDVNPADVASIIAGHPIKNAEIPTELCSMLHSIISGPIDADKLDYLRRDSERLFVRAGQGMDISRVTSTLTLAVVPDGSNGRVVRMAVRSKGKRPAELVGRVRSHMFGVAYWHHSYRAIKAMIHWMLWSCIENMTRSGGKSEPTRQLADMFFRDLDATYAGAQPGIALIDARMSIPRTSAVPAAESFVVDWLAERGGVDGREMAGLLHSKRWFKAILTVDHHRNEADAFDESAEREAVQQIWTRLEQIFGRSERERWQLRMALARAAQDNVASWIKDQIQGNADTVVFDFSRRRDQFIATAGTKTLFLLDVPDPTRAFQDPLYYTRVERRSASTVNPSLPIPAIRSYDSLRLAEEFVVANGHVRLLCHPDFDDFISRAVSERTLLGLLAAAMGQTVSTPKSKA